MNPIVAVGGCCAAAASGHAAAEPTIALIKSRRRIAFAQGTTPSYIRITAEICIRITAEICDRWNAVNQNFAQQQFVTSHVSYGSFSTDPAGFASWSMSVPPRKRT